MAEPRVSPRVKLSEWDRLTEQLHRFGQSGDVTADAEVIRVEFGSAEIEVSRDGRLRTGMPLHEFAQDDTVAVVVDHDAGTLTVESDAVSYTFRRPGG